MNNGVPDIIVLDDAPYSSSFAWNVIHLFVELSKPVRCQGELKATLLHGINLSHFRLITSCSKKLNDFDILKCLIPLRQTMKENKDLSLGNHHEVSCFAFLRYRCELVHCGKALGFGFGERSGLIQSFLLYY